MASYALYPNPPFFCLNKTVIQKIFQYSQVSNSPNCVEILKIGWLYIGVIISYAAIHRYTDTHTDDQVFSAPHQIAVIRSMNFC